MAQDSDIEWTNDTWNPWQGCTKISAGCKNCYMFAGKRRWGADPTKITRSSVATFNAPLRKLKGPLVFTCSWSDFFHPAADEWRGEAWRIIRNTPHLTYQILTKRPEDARLRMPADWGGGWPNVWLGVTVEAPKYLYRTDLITDIPAQKYFISYEPALEAVNFADYEKYTISFFDWIISGGESGASARPASLDWFRSVRDQCNKFRIHYFHKQHGGRRKIDNHWGGRLLDGRTHDAIPDFTVTKKEAMVQGSLF